MTARRNRPFDLQSLAHFLRLPADKETKGWLAPGLAALLEQRCEINRQWTHRRWRMGISEWEADRLACAFGRHPSEIWPRWWDDVLDGETEATAA